MLKVVVEARASTVIGRSSSLSAFLRLSRPLNKLAFNKSIDFSEMSTESLLRDELFDFDVLFLNRPTSGDSLSLLERTNKKNVPVIVDVDDWMYSVPNYGANLLHKSDSGLLPRIMNGASALTVPTSFFRQVMKPLYSGPTFIVPYGFDFTPELENINKLERPHRKIIMSSMFTLKLGSRLGEFAFAVKRFLKENPLWVIDFYCENFDRGYFNSEQINLLKPVEFNDYLDLLSGSNYQFALVPLAGHEDEDELLFNACKSPLKFIDYSANRIPGIYSRSPVFQSVIENGKNGLLVDNTADDWYRAMSVMASDDALRHRIADNCYESALKRFSLEQSMLAIQAAIECVINE